MKVFKTAAGVKVVSVEELNEELDVLKKLIKSLDDDITVQLVLMAIGATFREVK